MKNKSFILALLLSGATLTGCGLGGGGEQIDETKTQIRIYNYSGGYGSKWIQSLADEYAELVKDRSFEAGKTGVQFHITKDKTHYTSADTINGLTGIDIVFDEGMPYNMFVASNCVRDISEVVTSENPYDNNKKVIDKFNESQKSAFNKSGKYYAMPGYSGSYGIAYNKTLMDENELYFSSTGGWTNFAGNKSVGPDGEANTFDDGLPNSVEQFNKLCERATSRSLVPIITAGSTSDYYYPAFLTNFAASWDGKDFAEGRLTSEITNAKVVKLSNPSETETINITTSNGYEVMRSEGLYKAFELTQNLFSHGYMADRKGGTSTIFTSTVDHIATQKHFIEKCNNGSKALMLIEGDWWFNEAEEAVQKNYGNDLSKANFGWMPIPTKEGNTESVYYDSLKDYCYVRKGIDENCWPAIKDFLFYAYSDKSLNNFTKITNTRWGLSYELTYEVKNSLHPFGKSLMDFYSSSHTHIIQANSQNSFFIQNEGLIKPNDQSYIKTDTYGNIVRYLYNQGDICGGGRTAGTFISKLHDEWSKKNIWNR